MWGSILPTELFVTSAENETGRSTHGVSSSSVQGSGLEKIRKLFITKAYGGINGVLWQPGSVGLSVLLQSGGVQNELEEIQEAIRILGWRENDH